MTPDQARAMLETTLREIVPDADLSTLAPGADLRSTFELDSLDFVELVDKLSTRAGFRIEEDDADGLRSAEAVTQFLVTRSSHVGQQA
ncbi:MAG TPA: acyl carrier protein [Dermatophilaceae bacterium]|nr:acyl carrier protein [Dermatophilaceae bacterium]